MLRLMVPFYAVLFLSSARAEAPLRTALHWTRARGAERCIDGRTLARRVEELTGPVFVAPAEAERALEGSIARTRRGYTARIASVVEGGRKTGERELSTKERDCHALDAALVFVLALTIDPELARTAPPELLAMFASELPPELALLDELEATPPTPAEVPEAPPPAPPPPSPAAPVPPPAARPSRPPTHVRIMLGAAWLGRTLPDWSPGPEATAQVDFPRFWPLSLTMRAFPRAVHLAVDAGSARFRAYALALATCPLDLGREAARFQGCLGGELTALRGSGEGFARSHTRTIWEPSLLAEALLHVALFRGFGLYGRAAGGVRLTRQRFAAEGATQREDVFTPARIGVTLSAGAAYAF